MEIRSPPGRAIAVACIDLTPLQAIAYPGIQQHSSVAMIRSSNVFAYNVINVIIMSMFVAPRMMTRHMSHII